jgi:hypothetical protein
MKLHHCHNLSSQQRSTRTARPIDHDNSAEQLTTTREQQSTTPTPTNPTTRHSKLNTKPRRCFLDILDVAASLDAVALATPDVVATLVETALGVVQALLRLALPGITATAILTVTRAVMTAVVVLAAAALVVEAVEEAGLVDALGV